MPNYQDGKIYTIRNYTDNEMIYVGSTTETLSRRLAKHRYDCKRGKGCSLYKYIVNDDWSDFYIELYEYYPCNERAELDRREGEVIREIGTINKCIAGRSQKEWREENVEYIKEYKKTYREDNTEYIKETNKKYREENPEYFKEYREDNTEYIKEYNKKWREDNAEYIKEKAKIQICCNICGAFMRTDSIRKHQKTKKCTDIASKK